MPVQSTCRHCGKAFTHKPSEKRTYCSRACHRPPRRGIVQPDGTVLIPLTQGKFAIVDAADAERVLAFVWRYNDGYAKRSEGGRQSVRTVAMHRWLLGVPEGMDTDHINGNKLDNRRSNLRPSTRSQNQCNRTLPRTNTSGYKGVSFDKTQGCWQANIKADRKQRNLGRFSTPEHAARAYDAAARELHGAFARPNFPDDPTEARHGDLDVGT